MKRVAEKVAKIDDFFGRKSKTSKGKFLARLEKQIKKQIDWTPRRHKT